MSFGLKDIAKAFVPDSIGALLGGGNDRPTGSGFNVNDMVSELNKSGMAKTSHFDVYVYGPASISGIERGLAMRIDTIDIPGRGFNPIAHKFTNIGPVNKIAGEQYYSDVTATVILSEDMREKQYFEKWHSTIVDTGWTEHAVMTEQESMLADQSAEFGVVPNTFEPTLYTRSKFTSNYFDNYIGSVDIRQYGPGGDLRSIHTLQECFPVQISPIGMNWADDAPAKLSVIFSYRKYKAVFHRANQPGLGAGFSFSLGPGGLKLGARLPGIGNISYAKGAGLGVNAQPLKKKIFSAVGL